MSVALTNVSQNCLSNAIRRHLMIFITFTVISILDIYIHMCIHTQIQSPMQLYLLLVESPLPPCLHINSRTSSGHTGLTSDIYIMIFINFISYINSIIYPQSQAINYSSAYQRYIRGLLQKSWQHYFSEISKSPTGISKFAAERQQRLISNDAARSGLSNAAPAGAMVPATYFPGARDILSWHPILLCQL
jgi:hypothetical protein